MTKKIKKFDDFKIKKDQEVHYDQDGMSILVKNDDGEYEEVDGPVDILQITGVLDDPVDIEKIKKVDEAFTLDTSVVIKDIKIGDTLYLTALIEKKSSGTARNPQNWAVVQVRVVNYYWGLNKLNQLARNK